MATSSEQPPAGTPPQGSGSRPTSTGQDAHSTSPVEMRTLPAAEPVADTAAPSTDASDAASLPAASPQTQDAQHPGPSEPSAATTTSLNPPPADLTRSETEAIGPSTDTPASNPDNANGPVVVIMLLLTTGARHPYKIDEKYLKKRNVTVENNDPYNIGVYTLKELIWRDWREEWEPRPTAPASIRLIHFGRMLEDKSPLKECRFQTEAPNVVHMTVKPQEVVDEEDAKGGKGGSRRDGEEEVTAGCRCVIL
ncbi:hypothetical protein P280DRAFT_136916 [Massarina eburnea CBS 473.64]|uniref:UBL3-like ubiquitin domain-containing protein n=1 Tax=Massarina eburnea CBS 473.64 TaxID=1395130 RepID=A0A6A6RNU8_9PLEO|nr:hypothetical protein P280DRAFT_136916 [Massarina eburnea CBS 473.64]